MFGKFSQSAEEALEIAKQTALDMGHNYVGTEHILVGLIEEGQGVASKVLELQGLTSDEVVKEIEEFVGVGDYSGKTKCDFTPRTKKILDASMAKAQKFGEAYVGTEHILLAILEDKNSLAVKVLNELSVNIDKIYDDLLGMLRGLNKDANIDIESSSDERNEKATYEKYTTDLTKLAEKNKLDPVIGRQKEIDRVIQILSRRTKNNPCLIGEPGVGKTAIIEGLAQNIVSGNVPEMLKGKRVLSLDISGMVAGTKYRGEFEARIKKVIEELKANTNIIIFIDELHTIIGAGSAEGSLDAANILKPSLARGELQVVGATTIDEFRKHIEKDAALERRFQPVKVEEPTSDETLEILKGLRDKYEAHHDVVITDEALKSAVKLSTRYLTDRFLPDKAIDVIDEASSKVKLSGYTKPEEITKEESKLDDLKLEKERLIKSEEFEKAGLVKKKEVALKNKIEKLYEKWNTNKNVNKAVVSEKEIGLVIENWTGVPVTKLEEEESVRLTKLEELLHERIVGQEDAVKAVATAVRRGRVGLKDPKRPIGSFLFLGPTGVGKTELTKALAEVMFGDEKFMIRIDMSEYMEKHATSKLIGAPPGYVGYDEAGQLTEAIRRKPYSVILFDEVEKAHPDVFNILLQILDDGHITDSQGRRVDFKNTVIIMTSNIGARDITKPQQLGFGSSKKNLDTDYKDMKKNVMDKLKEQFKPEFLNRIDEITVFHKLNEDNIKDIVKILIKGLIKKAKDNTKIELKVTDNAINFIAKEGYDAAYGARPLKRAIQSKFEDLLAEKILEGIIKEGDTVTLDVVKKNDKEEVIVKTKKEKPSKEVTKEKVVKEKTTKTKTTKTKVA
ncbi:MAG: ATP-dependent Clp protease ATP-binding subunit, partial [Clostridia bacterium]|nr:ATP-dependent Clp protease ATP-binding subunit [Clostridia bacterium]